MSCSFRAAIAAIDWSCRPNACSFESGVVLLPWWVSLKYRMMPFGLQSTALNLNINLMNVQLVRFYCFRKVQTKVPTLSFLLLWLNTIASWLPTKTRCTFPQDSHLLHLMKSFSQLCHLVVEASRSKIDETNRFDVLKGLRLELRHTEVGLTKTYKNCKVGPWLRWLAKSRFRTWSALRWAAFAPSALDAL